MELKLIGIRKSYGSKEVLKDCSFTFEKGKIYGLLGRNGAGVLPEFLTGYEFIKFYMDIHEGEIPQEKTVDEYFDMVKIEHEDRHRLIKGYSHGMKNKDQDPAISHISGDHLSGPVK